MPARSEATFPAVDQPAVYTVKQFCRAHSISNGKFYAMVKEGTAPTTMRVGTRRMISIEEAARWRAALTKASRATKERAPQAGRPQG
jgi:hypothetical protein